MSSGMFHPMFGVGRSAIAAQCGCGGGARAMDATAHTDTDTAPSTPRNTQSIWSAARNLLPASCKILGGTGVAMVASRPTNSVAAAAEAADTDRQGASSSRTAAASLDPSTSSSSSSATTSTTTTRTTDISLERIEEDPEEIDLHNVGSISMTLIHLPPGT